MSSNDSEKKYYEGYIDIKAYITYGVHARSKEEAINLIQSYLDEEGFDLSDADWDEMDFVEEDVTEVSTATYGVINIDEEDTE